MSDGQLNAPREDITPEKIGGEQRKPGIGRFPIFMGVLGSLVGSVFYMVRDGTQPQFVQPHIRASLYIAPLGCAVQNYNPYDDISETCKSQKYRIDNYYKLGFPIHKGTVEYFRVGNDAISISCASLLWLSFHTKCEVRDIVNNVYYQ